MGLEGQVFSVMDDELAKHLETLSEMGPGLGELRPLTNSKHELFYASDARSILLPGPTLMVMRLQRTVDKLDAENQVKTYIGEHIPGYNMPSEEILFFSALTHEGIYDSEKSTVFRTDEAKLRGRIMEEAGLRDHYSSYRGKGFPLSIRMLAPGKVSKALQRHSCTSEKETSPPYSELITTLNNLAHKENTRSLTRTWKAAYCIIAAHIGIADIDGEERDKHFKTLNNYLTGKVLHRCNGGINPPSL